MNRSDLGAFPAHSGTLPVPPSRFSLAVPQGERFRPTLTFIGLVVYLWVIHSAKAPIGAHAIGLGVAGVFFLPGQIRFPAPLVCFAGFLCWAVIGSFTTYYQTAEETNILWDYAKLGLILFVSINVVRGRRDLYYLIVAWLAIFALYPVRGTFFNFMIGHQYFGRYAWNFIFRNPNDLAALTIPVLALAIAVAQGKDSARWIRYSAWTGIVILPLLILLTQSRGGILALATLGLFILVQYRRQAKALAVTVLVAGVLIVMAPPEVWTRLAGLTAIGDAETLAEVDPEGSAEGRFDIWRVAVAITMDNPLTGVGLGAYPLANADYADRMDVVPQARGRKDTHSMYLNTAAETGLVGLALLLAMLGTTLATGRRHVRALAETDPVAARQLTTLLIGLVAFMQAGLFASLHRVAFLYVYVGIVFAACYVFQQKGRFSRQPIPRGPAGPNDGRQRPSRGIVGSVGQYPRSAIRREP